MPVQVFWTLFLLSLSVFSLCFNILDNNLLSDVHSANMFYQPGLSSHSLNIVFHRAEILNFSEVQLVDYFFQYFAFDVISKKSLPYLKLSVTSALLSPMIFYI